MAVLATNDFPPHHGGIQRLMSRLAQELALQNKHVVVVAPSAKESGRFDSAQTFAVMRYLDAGRPIGFASMTAALLLACRRKKNSFTVASMWFPAGLAACFVPRFMRGKFCVLAHGSEIAPQRY